MTTHVFIVDHRTFKIHLEYLFVGTGNSDKIIDFNNCSTSVAYAGNKSKTEDGLVGMMADFLRLRRGDAVIFYLLQKSALNKITGGKFYGIFKVKSVFPFLDHNDVDQFLAYELGKSLTFRALIEPFQVYAKGVSEWEALDEIKNIGSPHQMIWSLIYRKLKANRGNTMITAPESDRLTKLIRDKNDRKMLESRSYSFEIDSEEIVAADAEQLYAGRSEGVNLLPRLVGKYEKRLQFETHLQAHIVQNIETLNIFGPGKVEWIGNEISCGVGMQRIDIMISMLREGQRVCIPIELKSTEAFQGIHNQLQRYVDWIEQYYNPNQPSDIEPTIVARRIENKESQFYSDLLGEFRNFNERNNTIKLRYVEFSINVEQGTIAFEQVDY